MNPRPIPMALGRIRWRAACPTDLRTLGTPLLVAALLFQATGPPARAQSAIQDPQSAIGNPYLFQGARYDEETGFYYFRNRYYNPRAGRFLQRDPVWDEQNVGGPYTFAANNPASAADPHGDFAFIPLLIIVGKAVAAGAVIGYTGSALRQSAQYASGERPAHTFTFSAVMKECGTAAGVGAAVAPATVLLPEVAVPVLTGVGLTSAVSEYQQGRPVTATFDAGTSLLGGGLGARSAFGRGSLWRPQPGQTRGDTLLGRLGQASGFGDGLSGPGPRVGGNTGRLVLGELETLLAGQRGPRTGPGETQVVRNLGEAFRVYDEAMAMQARGVSGFAIRNFLVHKARAIDPKCSRAFLETVYEIGMAEWAAARPVNAPGAPEVFHVGEWRGWQPGQVIRLELGPENVALQAARAQGRIAAGDNR